MDNTLLSPYAMRRKRRALPKQHHVLPAGGVLLLIHLSGLTSLDVSYLTPFSDARAARAILRPRLIRQKWREAALRPQDLRNQGDRT